MKMKRTPHALVALVALVALSAFAPAAARADTPPSRWDRVRDPEVGKTYRLHVEVQRRLARDDADLVSRFSPAIESQKDRARAMLERENADRSADVRLRFDLGRVYLELGSSQGRTYHVKAAEVLKAALAMAPDHPAAEEGWLNLAFACGHLGDHECEKKAYVEVLRRQTEDMRRATPSLNLAETEMHLGNLEQAIEGYRETLRLSGRFPSRETGPLAVWGLAVALDRSGDSVAGEKEARFALELERSMGGASSLLRSTGVFFVPAWEIHWYEGLGASAQAKVTTNPSEAVRLWRFAEQSYASYVRLGEPARDRWVPLAKLRHAAAKAEREQAEKRRPKVPAGRPEGEEPEETPL